MFTGICGALTVVDDMFLRNVTIGDTCDCLFHHSGCCRGFWINTVVAIF